jgi:hypothetical protein
MNDNVEIIAATLQRIQEEGKRNNFAIFEGDVRRNYYIQFSAEPGSTFLTAEAVSNRFLKPENILSPDQQARMRQLGWTPPQIGNNKGPNFYWRWEADTDAARQAIAELIVRTFVEGYGLAPDKPLIVSLVLE